MNAASDTKVCPMCAETIKTAARKCPYCQTRQGRCVLWHADLAPALGAAFVLGLSVVILYWLVPEESRSAGLDFARHRRELAVGKLAWIPDGTASRVSGYVTNTGPHAWRVQELELRFQDSAGRLLDVRHPYLKPSFVVEPGQVHAFIAELGSLGWTNADIVPRARVQAAIDGHLRNPDD